MTRLNVNIFDVVEIYFKETEGGEGKRRDERINLHEQISVVCIESFL